MQNFTFVIKQISGTANKVVDAFSRKCLLMQEFRVKTLGFDNLKEMYRDDIDFKEAYEAYENPMDQIYDPRWIVIQGKSAMYSKILHEGEFVERKTQWRIGRTLWS